MVAAVYNGKIILLNHYRHISDSMSLELPGGIIDRGESPKEAAKRELLEETGFVAKKITQIHKFYTSNGTTTEKIFFYRAEELTFEGQHPDDIEFNLQVILYTVEECEELIKSGEIECMSTSLCLMLLKTNLGLL